MKKLMVFLLLCSMALGQSWTDMPQPMRYDGESVIFQPPMDLVTFFKILDADGGTPVFNVDTTNERVGIGTEAPTARIDIRNGTTSDQLRITDGTSASTNYYKLGRNAATGFLDFQGTQAGFTGYVFKTHAADVVTINGSGVTSIGDGGTTNYTQIAADGDTHWVGTGGLVYGHCYGDEIGFVLNGGSAVQNTWYEIVDADMVSGPLNNCTHDGNGAITVTEPGHYRVTASVSFENDTSGNHSQWTISINDTETGGVMHHEAFGAAKHGSVTVTGIYDCADNATIEVSGRTTDAGTPDITIDHLMITVTQIGGT